MKQIISAILLTFSAFALTTTAYGETLEVGVDQALNASETVETPGDPRGLTASLTTSVGTTFDPDEPEGALTFEPTVGWVFNDEQSLSLYSAIVRPFNAYENFEAPKTVLTFAQKLDLWEGWATSAGGTVNALNLHRWSTDGSMVRWGVYGSVSRELAKDFTVGVSLSPFVQTNTYAQRTNGKNQVRWGLTESVKLGYGLGPVLLEAALVIGQRYNGASWSNSYSTVQAVSYSVSDRIIVGAAHGLISSLVDSSTGRFSSLRVFDGRDSEFSAFVTVAL